MKYTVNFSQLVSVTVTVDASNTASAIEAAYDEAPGSICARCSGWNRSWIRDDDGELLVESVSDESGDIVYTEPETWQRMPLIPMEG